MFVDVELVEGAELVGRSGSFRGKADWAVKSTKFQPLSALAVAGGGGVAIRVEGAALGSNGAGAAPLVGVGFAVGTAGGGGGREGKASLISPARTALKVSAILLGAIKRVAIANVAKLSGRINPFKTAPTTANTALSTQKPSNPSTTHLCCDITLL